MNVASDESNVLTIKTIQITPFKTLMSALKDILIETNIVFTPDGIRIVNMDKTHTILVHIALDAANFESYECKKDKIVIGVNMMNFHKLINTIDNDDTLVLYIADQDYDNGVVQNLCMRFENGSIRQCKTQKLRLIEADAEDMEYPNVTFSSELTMPSGDFQKIVRDLSSISDTIEIKSFGDELIFRVSGCFAEAEVHRFETDGGIEFIKKQDASVINQGIFSLKNLGYFIKCTNLCSRIELYIQNDMPLVVKYSVASLGEIKLCLAPLPSM